MANGDDKVRIITRRGGVVFISGVLIGSFLTFLITYNLIVWRPIPVVNFNTMRDECIEQCTSGGQRGADPECIGVCLREAVGELCAEYNEYAAANGLQLLDCD